MYRALSCSFRKGRAISIPWKTLSIAKISPGTTMYLVALWCETWLWGMFSLVCAQQLKKDSHCEDRGTIENSTRSPQLGVPASTGTFARPTSRNHGIIPSAPVALEIVSCLCIRPPRTQCPAVHSMEGSIWHGKIGLDTTWPSIHSWDCQGTLVYYGVALSPAHQKKP